LGISGWSGTQISTRGYGLAALSPLLAPPRRRRQLGACNMRAAVSSPAPQCLSRRRTTLLDARHVFDHVPQRRVPPLAAALRTQPADASVAARKRARRSALSAAPICSATPGTKAYPSLLLSAVHLLTFVAAPLCNGVIFVILRRWRGQVVFLEFSGSRAFGEALGL
jgi:hypothetical protein